MLLAPALEGSVQVILDCPGVRRRGTAEGIQINQEEKLPLPSIQSLPPTVLHHCWCQTVNLQAQHFTKPLEHQLSLSHATSAPQKSQLSLRGSPCSCPSQGNFNPYPKPPGYLFPDKSARASPPCSTMLKALKQPRGLQGGCSWGPEVCHVLGQRGNTPLVKVTQIFHPTQHPRGQHPCAPQQAGTEECSAWQDRVGER